MEGRTTYLTGHSHGSSSQYNKALGGRWHSLMPLSPKEVLPFQAGGKWAFNSLRNKSCGLGSTYRRIVSNLFTATRWMRSCGTTWGTIDFVGKLDSVLKATPKKAEMVLPHLVSRFGAMDLA